MAHTISHLPDYIYGNITHSLRKKIKTNTKEEQWREIVDHYNEFMTNNKKKQRSGWRLPLQQWPERHDVAMIASQLVRECRSRVDTLIAAFKGNCKNMGNMGIRTLNIDCPFKSPALDLSNVKRYHCQQNGHYARDCPQRKN